MTSALKRARATLRTQPARPGRTTPGRRNRPSRRTSSSGSPAPYEAGDVDGIIALFADDAWLTMPPAPLEYQGRALIARFLTAIAFRDGRTYRLVPTRANGQLAFAAYLREPA